MGGRTLCRSQLCPGGASDANMAVPKTGRARALGFNVPFYEDRSGRWAAGGEEEILQLYAANIPRVSNLDQDFGVSR